MLPSQRGFGAVLSRGKAVSARTTSIVNKDFIFIIPLFLLVPFDCKPAPYLFFLNHYFPKAV